jgi:hypothetical protein
MADWDPYRARALGQHWREERYRAGDWPSVKSVRNHFGRLSTAIERAGLVPRYQGQRRHRTDAALDIETLLHVAHLKELRADGTASESLVAAVREVSRARVSPDPADLRTALVELAASALTWAESVDGQFELDPAVRLAG